MKQISLCSAGTTTLVSIYNLSPESKLTMKLRANWLGLHLENWLPFTKSGSSNVVDIDGKSTRRKSSSVMAIAAPVAAKGVEVDSHSHSQVGMTNGHKHKVLIANGVPVIGDELSKPAVTSPSRLIELAQTITKETEKLDKYLKESGCSMPSFDVDAPMDFPSLPEEIQRARQKVVESTKELGDLVVGPKEGIRWMAWDVSSHYKPSISDSRPSFLESNR
jgi:hypothetical protein